MSLALAALPFLAVPAALIALAIWSGSGSPVLFRQVRIGRHGKPFRILKFRTMIPGAPACTSVTRAGDPRITPIGAFLRRRKLDELPQIWNVLRGEMGLVGPRADVPGFADRLSGPSRVILEVRPGITGPATLAYRDEEDLLARQPDPERFNADVIYPDKVRINRAYVERLSLKADLLCLVQTVQQVLYRSRSVTVAARPCI